MANETIQECTNVKGEGRLRLARSDPQATAAPEAMPLAETGSNPRSLGVAYPTVDDGRRAEVAIGRSLSPVVLAADVRRAPALRSVF
jgi:hypothetical protein